MAKLDADTFVTSEEAAARLKVVPRTLDRYVKDGLLQKFKLGKRRIAYKLDDLEAHVARLNGGSAIGLPTPAPAAARPDYQSPGTGMIVEASDMTASEAEAFHRLLVKLGFSGVMVMLSRGHLILTWPDALGYTEELINRKFEKALRKGERFA